MPTNRGLLAIIIVALAAMLAACGGGGTITPPADENPGGDTGGQLLNAADLSEWADQTEFSDTPKVARGIPPVPRDTSKLPRSISEVENPFVLGKDALDFSQCAVDGDAMLINVQGAAADNADGLPAWALYRIGGLNDIDPLSLNVECMPGGFGQEYSIAVADYTTYEWQWFGPTGFPEYEIDLTDENHRYTTHLGNLYFLVVCYSTNTATHYRSTVVAGNGGSRLPGAPGGLVASKGDFEDGVGLVWLPGDGADYYEVFRKDELFIFDPPPGNRPGDPAGDPGTEPWPDPDRAEWVLIGIAQATEYFDFEVRPGMVYMYKVRSVNSAGESGFSNIDEGWAYFNDPPPMFDGIHGYAYAEHWYWDDDDPPPPGGDPGWDGGPRPDGDPGYPGDPGCPMEPLPGVLITLMTIDPLRDGDDSNPPFDPGNPGGDIVAQTETNDEGFYQFLDTPVGVYLLMAEKEGWVFWEIYFVEVDGPDYAMQFDFFGFFDEEPPWIEPEGIHGYVWAEYWDDNGDGTPGDPGRGPDGEAGCWIEPLADVKIIFTSSNTDAPVWTFTNEDGFYQMLDLAPGYYEVTAELEGWNMQPQAHYVEVFDEVPSIALDFFAWQGEWEDPEPGPELEGIFGWVFGDYGWGNEPPGDPGSDPDGGPGGPYGPLPLAGVTITAAGQGFASTAITDENGFYHLEDVPLGEYVVSAELQRWMFEPEEYEIRLDEEMPGVECDFFGFPLGDY